MSLYTVYCVRFQVFTGVKIQTMVFKVVTVCSNVVGYQHFRGPFASIFKMNIQLM